MKYLLPFLLVAATTGLAQKHPTAYDFSKVDPSKTSVAQVDSLAKSIYLKVGLDSLAKLKAYLSERTFSPKYVAVVAGYTHSSASLGQLNSGLRALGIPEMSQDFGGIPLGADIRGKKFLFSYLFTPGLLNSVSDANYKIEVGGMQFEVLLGYDVLNSKRIHFYPLVALAFQDFRMSSFRTAASTDIISINDFVLNPSGTTISQTSFALTYGAELDFRLTNPYSRLGLILGLRYGRTQTLVEGSFKVDYKSSSFDSSDVFYGSFWSVVVKFYGRKQR